MEIITPRLLLREYREEDAAPFLAYQRDPRAQEFHESDGDQAGHLESLPTLFMQWATQIPRLNWQLAIAPRSAPGALVGSVGLRLAGQPPGEAEFGLELAPASWGQGYGTEAASALITFGFTTLALTTIRGTSVSANHRVAGLVRRLGFRCVEERDGPAAISHRGWREVTWELTLENWQKRTS